MQLPEDPLLRDTPKLPELSHKEHSAADKKIYTVIGKVLEVDVSGITSFFGRFIKKAIRSLNLGQVAIGAIVSCVMRNMSQAKGWDVERLKSGKHVTLEKVGAEHVKLQSKTTCEVDAHYLSAATFAQRLEDLGGKRSIFELEANSLSIFSGTKCFCHIGDVSVEVLEITRNKGEDEGDIAVQIRALTDKDYRVFRDEKTLKTYLIDMKDLESKVPSQTISEHFRGLLKGWMHNVEIEASSEMEVVPVKKCEFPAITFEKGSSSWKEASALLKGMGIEKSSWEIVETKKAVYLVPSDKGRVMRCVGQQNSKLSVIKKEAKASVESSERGVALLTMNLGSVYEQYLSEMLTFALEGVDVMMYNSPSKGLSTGRADRENINASIEASYQYLKRKNIPDEKILAKGQCFGAAPTAWLGRKHPNINVMMDQNPAEFHDVVIRQLNLMEMKKISNFTHLMNSSLIDRIVTVVLSGYSAIPEDLSKNQGHKLFNVSVPDERGWGGDMIVSTEDLGIMLDALSDTKGKVATLSMNIGAGHTEDWWTGDVSRESVTLFLKRIGISQSLFYT